jgi:hypothetical protein
MVAWTKLIKVELEKFEGRNNKSNSRLHIYSLKFKFKFKLR